MAEAQKSAHEEMAELREKIKSLEEELKKEEKEENKKEKKKKEWEVDWGIGFFGLFCPFPYIAIRSTR